MAHGFAVALEVSILAGTATGTQALAQDGPDRLGRRVARFGEVKFGAVARGQQDPAARAGRQHPLQGRRHLAGRDRKSTRLNSSHLVISYAVFCLKKKKNTQATAHTRRPRQTDMADPITPQSQAHSMRASAWHGDVLPPTDDIRPSPPDTI